MIKELSTDILFRQGVESDVPTIQLMADQLYVCDWNAQEVRTDMSLTFKELTQKPEKGRLIVFEIDGKIVGYSIIIFFWSNEYGGNIIEVDELYIVEDRRGSGIARELFNWLERTFADNLAGFSLQVSQHNDPMLRFTQKAGFSVPRYLHLFKLLRPGKGQMTAE